MDRSNLGGGPRARRAGAQRPGRPGYGDAGDEVPERDEGGALAAGLPSGGAVARCGGARAASVSRKVHGNQADGLSPSSRSVAIRAQRYSKEFSPFISAVKMRLM